MNRTQAKARATELGIDKDEARCFGNLTKTQTWLDAIAAHEAQLQDAVEVKVPSVVEAQSQPKTQDQIESVDPAMEIPAEVETYLEIETIPVEPTHPVPIVAESSVPLIADPWEDSEEEPESAPAISPAALTTEETTSPATTALIYPLLLLCVVIWAACQLLLGLGSLMTLGLNHLYNRADRAANLRLEQLRKPTGKSEPQSSSVQAASPWMDGIRETTLQPEG